MSDDDGLAALFVESSRNTALSWTLVVVLGVTLVGGAIGDRYESVLFGAAAIAVVVAPAVAFRDPTVMPPWYFVGLICLPVLWEAFSPWGLRTSVVPSLALATLGLVIAVELHRFTALRLVPRFAVALTALFTLAMAGLLNVLRWSVDVLFGTSFLLDGRSQDAINAAMMVEFGYAAVAGAVAGALFYLYFRRTSGRSGGRMAVTRVPEPRTAREAAVLSERLGVPSRRQALLVRAMQLVLAALFVYGLWTRRIDVPTNAALALAITFVPAVLERDYGIPIEPGLALWVTGAVFLHALGTAGMYGAIAPWDNLTHTLSATIVAAAGYATLRAIHLHGSSIHLTPWATFAFTLVFVLATGVVWELLEFVVDRGALLLGVDPVLAQHGVDDTIVDLVFDVVGAVLVATWGTVYLVEVSDVLAVRLEERFGVR